jgi:hypothetical protein
MNGVPKNRPFRVVAGKSCDADTVQAVKCDYIAFARIGSSDYAITRYGHADTTISIAQPYCSGDVGADVVALDNCSCRATTDADARA